MAGAVLVLGLFTAVFLVKDKKIRRDYVSDKDGNYKRVKAKVAIDEDPDDSGSDVDNSLVGEGVHFIKGFSQTVWQKTKTLLQ